MIVPFFSALFVPTTNESRRKKMSLRHMSVNGECQLCQSKSNCLRTNLALLNLHLMFSPLPELAGQLSDCINAPLLPPRKW